MKHRHTVTSPNTSRRSAFRVRLSRLLLTGLVVAITGGTNVPAQPIGAPAGDAERGRARAVQCVACHGASGIAQNPTFPHLAGQHAAYLAAQLERFRSGAREHPLMTPIAMSLSDEEIGDLAVYFASISLPQKPA